MAQGKAVSALATLSKMLGLKGEPDYDILKNERAAKVAFSRRNLFAAGAAMAGSIVFTGDVFTPPPVFIEDPWAEARRFADIQKTLIGAIGILPLMWGYTCRPRDQATR